MTRRRFRPTPSFVVSCLALFVALSGTALALDDNSVRSRHIVDGEVKLDDVGAAAVASHELKNDSIQPGDVAPNSLTSGRIADGSLTDADVQNGGLTGSDVAPNSIPTGRITDGSLTGADVANNSLKGADIDESTLSGIGGGGPAGGDLTGTFPDPEIAPDAVGSGKVANGTLTGADLLDFSVGATDVGINALGPGNIQDNSLGVNEIDTSGVGSVELRSGAVESAEILDGAVGGAEIATGAVGGAEIANGAVGGVHVGSSQISSQHIAHGAVDGEEIRDGSVQALDLGDVERHSETRTTGQSGVATPTARCPDNSIPLGGGYSFRPVDGFVSNREIYVHFNGPTGTTNGFPSLPARPSWSVVAYNETGEPYEVTAYINCLLP